jgi:hypothetical protein
MPTVFDSYFLIPLLAMLIVPRGLVKIFHKKKDRKLRIRLGIILIAFFLLIPGLIKRYNACNKFNPNSLGTSFIDSRIANLCGVILVGIFNIIPFFRLPLAFLGGFINPVIWIIGYIIGYFIVNAANKAVTQNTYCNSSIMGKNIAENIIFVVSGGLLGYDLYQADKIV